MPPLILENKSPIKKASKRIAFKLAHLKYNIKPKI